MKTRQDKTGYWWMKDPLRYGWEVVEVFIPEEEFVICRGGIIGIESIPPWVCEFVYIGEKPTE